MLVIGVIGVVALLALVPVERRLRDPMVRLSLFASRQFDAINVTTFLLYGALGAAGYLVVLQVELQLGYTAAQAGAALIPTTAMLLVMSPISGALVSRIGPRWLMVFGHTRRWRQHSSGCRQLAPVQATPKRFCRRRCSGGWVSALPRRH